MKFLAFFLPFRDNNKSFLLLSARSRRPFPSWYLALTARFDLDKATVIRGERHKRGGRIIYYQPVRDNFFIEEDTCGGVSFAAAARGELCVQTARYKRGR